MTPERDACGIVCRIRKGGKATHGTLKRTLDSLVALGHRGGQIRGEGDGAGVMLDLPRELWSRRLGEAGKRPEAAEDPGFCVGHVLIPRPLREEAARVKDRIRNRWAGRGLDLLLERHHPAVSEALGPRGGANEPEFWQIAGVEPLSSDTITREAALEALRQETEEEEGVAVASLSSVSAVYKVQGAPPILPRYFPELRRPECRTHSCVGHSRYSTNTLSTVLRAQPFPTLAHNGEINTIERLRREAVTLGIPIPPGGSDSQDLDRILRSLVLRFGLTLFEAVELLFPPVHNEILHSPEILRSLYAGMRRCFDASAQGPAAVICRLGDAFVFGVDALGLRPLWLLETGRELIATSEAGVVPVEELESDPKPLAPGEKVGVEMDGGSLRVLHHAALQKEVLARFRRRVDLEASWSCLGLVRGKNSLPTTDAGEPEPEAGDLAQRRVRAGWGHHDEELFARTLEQGRDPVGSLGWDGPLAALSGTPVNLADHLHEDVAVVTNPAIDPKREGEHFSTRVRLGRRILPGDGPPYAPWISLETPLTLDGIPADAGRAVAARYDTALLRDAEGFLGADRVCRLSLGCGNETVAAELEELERRVVEAVEQGTHLLILEDDPARPPLDPLLAVARVDAALRAARSDPEAPALRRKASVVVVSDLLRNLHDVMCCLGLGADAVAPRLLWQSAWEKGGPEAVGVMLEVLGGGVRTVLSTMGIHEVTGYGRIFSAVGLEEELARTLEVENLGGGAGIGRSVEGLHHRYADRHASKGVSEAPARPFRIGPPAARLTRRLAAGEIGYGEYEARLEKAEREHPVCLRHLLDFRFPQSAGLETANPSIGDHAYPLYICPMSFGSQSEAAFRIYAEVGRRLRIPCMNGEGGEIPDMLGRYRGFRSQQVASGRFGVHPELLSSVDLLEIKIGQGAKPGEGGHLPGRKVTAKVAAARNATPGVPLISPSNQHDIYSIEDLAQLVEELRVVNPSCRISVKVPVVSGIGTIALGIAKAGADILTLSGYDGGTGAARLHALRRVGLPVEAGIAAAHRSLAEAGLRPGVELWADGGMRSAADVMKCLCLGADRVGFGTWALVGIGCVLCRSCHLDACPRGISTQVESVEEADRRGLKRFVPQEHEAGVEALSNLLQEIGTEVARLTARLGFGRTRDVVGRTDLLRQERQRERLDLGELLRPVEDTAPEPDETARTVRRPLSYLTRVASRAVMGGVRGGSRRILYEDDRVLSSDRALGTHLSGEAVRAREQGEVRKDWAASLHLGPGAVPGNGLGAFNAREVEIRVDGGSQDGVAKGARGGSVVVLKGENHDGRPVGGCVGKGFAYGAQEGRFVVQGEADSRCGVRLSGADLVVGGRIREPLLDGLGFLADRANLKGFAFEYMTAGRALVLGDPGPWLCSGMTGGVVYVHLSPNLGLTEEAVHRRLALGSTVRVRPLDDRGAADVAELLAAYREELMRSPVPANEEEARWVASLLADLPAGFVALRPELEEEGPLQSVGD